MANVEQTGAMNAYCQVAPAQYLDQEGVVAECGKHARQFGERALVSGGPQALDSVRAELFESLESSGIKWQCHTFRGYPTMASVEGIASKADAFSADFVIGVGGGRSLDAAKAASSIAGLPVVTIPTIAATCAAASAVSVLYDEKGRYVGDFYLSSCPPLVLADSRVVAHAPAEYLVSGILDALSKYYEGRVAMRKFSQPDAFTIAAISLATSLSEMIHSDALDAVSLVRRQSTGRPLRNIIDLNVHVTAMIQGLGKTSTRGAAAHAIHNGLTVLEESHSILHGIKVGYGIVVQLFLEQAQEDEIAAVVSFFRKLGVEPSLTSLKLPSDVSTLRAVAQRAASDPIMSRMPFAVDSAMVEQAMLRVESALMNAC